MKFSCENCDGRRNWGNPSPGDEQRVAVSVSVWVTFRVMALVSTTTITKRQTWSTCPTYCTRVAAQLQLSVCLSVRLSVVLATNLVNWRARLTFLTSFCCGAFFSLWKWKCFRFFLFVCHVSAYIRGAQIRIFLLLLLPLSMGMLPMRNWPRPKRLAKRWKKGGRERENKRREWELVMRFGRGFFLVALFEFIREMQ